MSIEDTLNFICKNLKPPKKFLRRFQTVDKVALEFTFQSNFSFMKQILFEFVK